MLVFVQRKLQPRSIDGTPIVYMEIGKLGKLGSTEFLLKLAILSQLGIERVQACTR